MCSFPSCKWHSDFVTAKPRAPDRQTVGDYDPHHVSVGGGPVQEQPAEADRDPHGKRGLVHPLPEIQRVQAFRYCIG